MSEPKVLAQPPGEHCVTGVKHVGDPQGKVEQINGVDTYIAIPTSTPKGVILFYADVFGPMYVNNQLIMDYFAEKGFITVGLDYFEGDPIFIHLDDESFDRNGWMERKKVRAKELVPGWNVAVKQRFGSEHRYTCVGYCFGAPVVLDVSATDEVVAGAIVHPAFLNEDHFVKCKAPLLLSCAEIDHTFPVDARRRAEDILVEKKHTYHFQVFSGVSHGFAIRGNPDVENERWAKEESADGIVRWFSRFSANAALPKPVKS